MKTNDGDLEIKPTWRLLPALVPLSLEGRSVFRALRRGAKWKRIRSMVIARARARCEICGQSRDKGMICHEVWSYDDTSDVATLTGFELVCPECNVALHIGGAGARKAMHFPADSLELDPTAIALDRLMEVNKMTFPEAVALLNHANRLLDERSQVQWEMQIAPSVVADFPFLAGLHL